MYQQRSMPLRSTILGQTRQRTATKSDVNLSNCGTDTEHSVFDNGDRQHSLTLVIAPQKCLHNDKKIILSDILPNTPRILCVTYNVSAAVITQNDSPLVK